MALNLHRIEAIVRDAAAAGADLLVLPHGILSGYHDHLDVDDDLGDPAVGPRRRPRRPVPARAAVTAVDRQSARPAAGAPSSTVPRWGRWRRRGPGGRPGRVLRHDRGRSTATGPTRRVCLGADGAVLGTHRKVHLPGRRGGLVPGRGRLRGDRHAGRARRADGRLRQDVPRGGPVPGARRRRDPGRARAPGRPAGPTGPPRSPATASAACSTSTTGPAPPRTSCGWCRPTRPGATGRCASSASRRWCGPTARSSPRRAPGPGWRWPTSSRARASTGPAGASTTSKERRPGAVPPARARRRGRGSTVRVALLTYSTRPRGGVVHTLALAEALAAPGRRRHGARPRARRRRRRSSARSTRR